MTSKSR